MKTFKTIAVKTSEVPEHVLSTMFIKGNIYIVRKNEVEGFEEYVICEGIFMNSLGGREKKERNVLKSEAKEFLNYI
jgi:hypothetical protein